MPGIGTSTIYTTILPNYSTLREIARNSKLSKEAKQRLKVLDYYFNKSGRNVTKTARYFGYSRAFIYKWLKRFNPRCLASLESHSCRPKHPRQCVYDYKLVQLVREYRQNPDTCLQSSKKLASIFWNEYTEEYCHVSPATIGRIIKRYNLFFHPHTTLKKRSNLAKSCFKSALKKRRPAGLIATAPRQLIEFDMKHVAANGQKYYYFCAIGQYTREAVVHSAKHCTSKQARIAIEKTIEVFGKDIAIVNDNGSENLGEMSKYLEEEKIMQYFTHPYAPKEKGKIERFIGTLDRECLVVRQKDIFSLSDLDYYVNNWLNIYHARRPHHSLRDKNSEYHYFTPAEYCATMGITILPRKVYTR